MTVDEEKREKNRDLAGQQDADVIPQDVTRRGFRAENAHIQHDLCSSPDYNLAIRGGVSLLTALSGASKRGYSMRSRIFGGIGVVWGGGILVSALLRGGTDGSGAYATGQTAGLVFGALLFITGCYYLLGGGSRKRE